MIMEGEIKAMEREKMILFFLHNKESISREGLHYIWLTLVSVFFYFFFHISFLNPIRLFCFREEKGLESPVELCLL